MKQIIAVVIFLLAIFMCASTPAAAQFGTNPQVYVFTPEAATDGSIEIRWYSTHCTEKAEVFFSLFKAERLEWVAMPTEEIRLILPGVVPGVSLRANLDRKLALGVYKLVARKFSLFSTVGTKPGGPCASGLKDFILKDEIVFSVGGSRDYVLRLPMAMASDQLTAIEERVISFGAYFPNPVRMIFSQRTLEGKVRYKVEDHPATGGPFYGRVRVNLPNNFDQNLPVDVNIQDKSTYQSISREMLPAGPPALPNQ